MSGWTSFRLVPDDVLFFRDGKPSTRGSDHYLRSLFPPYPSTLYGALRTRRLCDRGVEFAGLDEESWNDRVGELTEELGPWGGLGSLAVKGPWLVEGEEPLFPAPADLGIVSDPEPLEQPAAPRIQEAVRFRPISNPGQGGWSHPLRLLEPRKSADTSQPESRPAAGWFLRPAGWGAWRTGGVPVTSDFVHGSELWVDEVRTGLGLQSDRRTGVDGQLYTFGFIRLRQNVALGFEASGTRLTPDGRVRLGGEGRTAALEKGSPVPYSEDPLDGELVCLCFATPAFSDGGAYPPGFGPGRLTAELAGRRCRLVVAAVPGSTMVGGWDLANSMPKPLRRAIPAGATYLFEPEDGPAVAPEIARALDGTSLSDSPADRLQGFGLVLAGVTR